MLRAALIGMGRWGQNLVNSVQGKSELIRFVAGYARQPEKVRDYAASQNLVVYDDYAKLLADPTIQAVVLATPHTLHAEQIIAAAKAGKHVFTEKPFTLTSESAQAALAACAAHQVTLAVGYNWRFQPALQEIKRLLNDGKLGKLLHIEGNFCGPGVYRFDRDHWRQNREEGPGGGMTGRGVHVVDAMLYLAGHVESVIAQSDRRVQDFGIDDTTSMLFRFATGATAYLGSVIATAETWRMQVFGEHGWAEVGDVEHLSTWSLKTCYIDRTNLHRHAKPEVQQFATLSTERAELEHFAKAAAAGQPLAIAGGDEVHGVTVLEAIMRSAQSQQRVHLHPLRS